ncbi:MAG: UDP-3-O-acyl-N-acetylglucosamine deacetylase [Succinivibrionaceae bacterium]
MLKQRTLAKPVTVVGIGLHSGGKVTAVLRPASAGTGIVYTRTDLNPHVHFQCTADAVRDTQLCTALVNEDGVRISTVEHLSAALFAMGIDNLYIDVDAPEIPVMDGSSYPFVYLMSQAGVKDQKAPKEFIRVVKPVKVQDGEKWAMLEPSASGLQMDLTIDFNHPAMDREKQSISVDFSGELFRSEISKARTFCFLRDVEFMHSHNLALGGSLENAVVMDDYHVINEEGLRYENEFVKHKLLDAIGDLYMGNRTILGHFSAYKTGHHLNNLMLRELLSHKECYEVVTFADEKAKKTPISFLAPLSAGLSRF